MKPEELDAFLDCEWLQRSWTFQEVILASNPIIVRGNKAISWGSLFGGFVLYMKSGLLCYEYVYSESVKHTLQAAAPKARGRMTAELRFQRVIGAV